MTKTLLLRAIFFSAVLGMLGLPSSCYYDNEEDLYGDCDTSSVRYGNFIQPLLQNQCTPGCHSGAQPTGNLDFNQYINVKTAALDGRLWAALNRSTSWMPQNGPKLDDCTLQRIDTWIKAGAPEN
ncbi:MAG: hypothetical protein JNL02_14945 [Saprospiraceae bacterium]|nr:hypothetical protein [Saprospiraceae bacterium]